MKAVVITLLLFFTAAFAIGDFESPENSVMADMPRSELMETLACIAASKGRQLCEWYSKCLSVLPESVMISYSRCRELYTGYDWIPCSIPGPLWPTPTAGGDVFDCSNEYYNRVYNREETPEEIKAMERFETCARELYANGCAHRPRRHRLY